MEDLVQVLRRSQGVALASATEEDILVSTDFADDAAVVCPEPGSARALVMTADVIAPLVNDPASFGRIAATNAISDVYAMGGRPLYALNLVFFPDDRLPMEVLDQVLAGSARACADAGVRVVGGHSVRDPEIKFGLSVTGEVARDQILSNRGARAGQRLVLSKAIGTGVIGQAIKQGQAEPGEIDAAVASMTTLNRGALEAGRRHRVTAATDVTGFGLLGHLRNVLMGSGLSATIELGAVPLLPGVRRWAEAGLVPGGSRANHRFLAPSLHGAASLDPVNLLLACDAQTSGGLLLCVDPERAARLVADLIDQGLPAAEVGGLRPGGGDGVDATGAVELRG